MHSPCAKVEQGIHPALAGCLHALLSHAHGLHGEGLDCWVRQQRLQPVIYGVGGAVDDFFSPSFLDECRYAYFTMIGRSHRFLAEAEQLKSLLGEKGIVALAWRGAVYGQDLYGDSGLRGYLDLDILVAPAHKRSALSVLSGGGYRLRERALPAWFLARHHLHWPMISPDGQVLIDVHWAVDHPYKISPCVPADVFLDKHNDVAQILLGALHVEKEARLHNCVGEEALRDRLFRVGPVWPWLDLALMMDTAIRNGKERELENLAQTHSASALIDRVRFVLSRWFDVAGCRQAVVERKQAGRNRSDHRWAIRLAKGLGCRPDVMTDWVDYIREPTSIYQRTVRILKILRLGVDAAFCGVYVTGRAMAQKGEMNAR